MTLFCLTFPLFPPHPICFHPGYTILHYPTPRPFYPTAPPHPIRITLKPSHPSSSSCSSTGFIFYQEELVWTGYFGFYNTRLLQIHPPPLRPQNRFCLLYYMYTVLFKRWFSLCLFCSGLTSLSTIFQSYHGGVRFMRLWQGAHCSLL